MREQSTWNANRKYHLIPVYKPDLKRVERIQFPIIKKEGIDLKKIGSQQAKAKKRWKKFTKVNRAATILDAFKGGGGGGDKKAPPASKNPLLAFAQKGRAKTMIDMSGKLGGLSQPGKTKTKLGDLFSPVKGKASSPLSSSSLFALTEMNSNPTALVGPTANNPASGTPPMITSDNNPFNNMKKSRSLYFEPKPFEEKKDAEKMKRIIKNKKQRKEMLAKEGKKRMTAREKEKILLSRTKQLDDMINKLEDRPSITNEEIDAIVNYMDGDQSGSVDEGEFAFSIKQAKRGLVEDENITKLLTKLDNELRVKQIRLKDLFKQFDVSCDGILSVLELREGLNTLCDVSWEKECERRKLRREAVMGRWKGKEEERDRAKCWLTAADSLPEEFVKERDFFARDIKTPHRFEKYMQVVIGSDELRFKTPNDGVVEKANVGSSLANWKLDDTVVITRNKAFDIDSIDDESVHTQIMQLVEEELKIERKEKIIDYQKNWFNNEGRQRREKRNSANSELLAVYETEMKMDQADMAHPQSPGTMRLAASSLSLEEELNNVDKGRRGDNLPVTGIEIQLDEDESSLGSIGSSIMDADVDVDVDVDVDEKSIVSSLGDDASIGSVGSASHFDRSVVSNITVDTGMSEGSSASALFLREIRKARGVMEDTDKEIASLVKFLGLNMDTLGSIKQRVFEKRTFKNLYNARMNSLSNDYYLPTSVLAILEREKMLKGQSAEDLEAESDKKKMIRRVIERAKREAAEREILKAQGVKFDKYGVMLKKDRIRLLKEEKEKRDRFNSDFDWQEFSGNLLSQISAVFTVVVLANQL